MSLRIGLSGMLGLIFAASAFASVRQQVSIEDEWKFSLSEKWAAGADFDDSKWRTVHVPHDWSIEGPFAEWNPTGGAGGFLPAGVGWYRKHFSLPKKYANRRIFIEFDGIMANSDVWINGVHLGKRPYGYVSFSYDMSRHVVFGNDRTNVLAVRADNSGQPASRWYTGAGIYRHVRLIITDPVHISKWSSYITTPRIEPAQAAIRVQTAVVNHSQKSRDITLHVTLLTAAGKPVAALKTKPRTIAFSESADFREELILSNPQLWQPDRPELYRAHLEVRSGSKILDEETVTFGIRDARFDPGTGFRLNGENLKIKGVCLHHDGGAFGAAVPLRVWERRLEQLRTLGVNAIRTAHNPPAPEFLDLCDRMGFLVMDELFDSWTVGKMPFDYHRHFNDWSHADLRETVLRDRNHPSIILYSAGNEIRDTTHADLAKRILSGLVAAFHRLDPFRPVTQGLFRPNVSRDYDNGLADLLDVVGTNYRDLELLAAWKAKSTRKIIGTEQRHDLATWLAARDHAPHAGQFLWSGIDYLGESPKWPVIGAGSGLLDRTGAIKPMAYERQSWWSDKPVVYVVRRISPAQVAPVDPGFEPLTRAQNQFEDWTPADTRPHDETVEAYSNCDEVELLLNGKSLGSKTRHADDSPRIWQVAWEAGSLKAIGRNRRAIVAEHQLRTAGKAARIVLSADRTTLTRSWEDVVFVTATLTDANGIPVPGAAHQVSFTITGPGIIAAVDNGDNASVEPFQASTRKAYQGRCYAMIQAGSSGGKITLTASADGLNSDSITLIIIRDSRFEIRD